MLVPLASLLYSVLWSRQPANKQTNNASYLNAPQFDDSTGVRGTESKYHYQMVSEALQEYAKVYLLPRRNVFLFTAIRSVAIGLDSWPKTKIPLDRRRQQHSGSANDEELNAN